MSGAISSTGKTDYTTPADIVEMVNGFFRRLRAQGHFAAGSDRAIDLDPCGHPESLVGAAWEYRLPDVDGLKAEVPTNVNQYINPPFGRIAKEWLKKAYRDFVEKNAATLVCVPDTPDTLSWRNHVFNVAEGRCQLGYRPIFGGKKTGIPKAISILYYGRPIFYEDFRMVFSQFGRVECPRLVYSGQTHLTWRRTKKQPVPVLDEMGMLVNGPRRQDQQSTVITLQANTHD